MGWLLWDRSAIKNPIVHVVVACVCVCNHLIGRQRVLYLFNHNTQFKNNSAPLNRWFLWAIVAVATRKTTTPNFPFISIVPLLFVSKAIKFIFLSLSRRTSNQPLNEFFKINEICNIFAHFQWFHVRNKTWRTQWKKHVKKKKLLHKNKLEKTKLFYCLTSTHPAWNQCLKNWQELLGSKSNVKIKQNP